MTAEVVRTMHLVQTQQFAINVAMHACYRGSYAPPMLCLCGRLARFTLCDSSHYTVHASLLNS